MGKFGWSYPAGCSGTPYDEFPPCEVCGRDPDDCLCPECPTCGTAGLLTCYRDHALKDDRRASAVLAAFTTEKVTTDRMRDLINVWADDWLQVMIGPDAEYYVYIQTIERLIERGKRAERMIRDIQALRASR